MQNYLGAGVALGVLTEALAYALALWLYHIAWMRIFNITLVFGMLFGALAWLTRDQPVVVPMAIGAGLGLVIEFVNDRWLKIWYFPGDPWTFFKGQPAVIGVGLSWALVAPIIGWVAENIIY